MLMARMTAAAGAVLLAGVLSGAGQAPAADAGTAPALPPLPRPPLEVADTGLSHVIHITEIPGYDPAIYGEPVSTPGQLEASRTLDERIGISGRDHFEERFRGMEWVDDGAVPVVYAVDIGPEDHAWAAAQEVPVRLRSRS